MFGIFELARDPAGGGGADGSQEEGAKDDGGMGRLRASDKVAG